MYTDIRPRRLRASAAIRDLAAETAADKKRLIMPHFVTESGLDREPIASMPGIDRVSVENLLRDAEAVLKLGIAYVLLFGIPAAKDEAASGAYAVEGVVQRAVRALKSRMPGLCVVTDVCLCEYMSHGHCGIVKDGRVLNDPTLELLARTAVSHAEAGADIVAPSDMMDGRIGAIREELDNADFTEVSLLAYTAKYASGFYGPFREALDSAPKFGDKKTYQMDPANAREALREAELDEAEGADMLDVDTGTLRTLSDGSGQFFQLARWSPEGDSVWYVSNADSSTTPLSSASWRDAR